MRPIQRPEGPMTEHATEGPPRKSRGKLLLFIALPVVLAAGGAGALFSGPFPGKKAEATTPAAAVEKPVFVDMPDIVANLNAPGRRSSYIKLRSKLEVARAADARALQEAMPRLQDLF